MAAKKDGIKMKISVKISDRRTIWPIFLPHKSIRRFRSVADAHKIAHINVTGIYT
jgi:hypothetical protein